MSETTLKYSHSHSRRKHRDNSLVLVVDDDKTLRKGMVFLLRNEGHSIIEAENGSVALELVAREKPDLVLLDLMMPEIDGLEVCQKIKRNDETRLIPVIMITAVNNQSQKIKAIESGADDFLNKPVNLSELRARTQSLLRMKHLNDLLDKADTVIAAMANAIEAKDKYTEGHNDRVSRLTVMLGKAANLGSKELDQVRMGGILHDIGKIGIPDNILNKQGPLNDEEFRMITSHPRKGEKILEPLRSLKEVGDIVLFHHERYDGKGYPEGLAGGDIPLHARIVAIADSFDAMTTDRPYRKALSREQAVSELESGAGTMWDPDLVDLFIDCLNRREKLQSNDSTAEDLNRD
ncbi:MAG: response regulator [Candidatus Glassbacteria bacterium]|nr:response regulator [Candidatus Glassbacteria bacterium]